MTAVMAAESKVAALAAAMAEGDVDMQVDG